LGITSQTIEGSLAGGISNTTFSGTGARLLEQWGRAVAVLVLSFVTFALLLLALDTLWPGNLSGSGESAVSHRASDVFAGILNGVLGVIAYLSAPTRREANLKPVLLLQTFSAAWMSLLLLVTHHVRENVVEPFYINGRSMLPTINAGDRILVAKCKAKVLKRGDLGVFVPPGNDPSLRYVKRLVAFGGETVEIRADGRIYIEDKLLDDPPFNQWLYVPKSGEFGTPVSSYKYTVPAGSYFFLGDNSSLSKDCRFYGAIPAYDVIGVAYKIFWPLDHAKAIGPR